MKIEPKPGEQEIQECRIVLTAGDNENHEDIFMARILPNGHVEISGNQYFQPLIEHVFSTVMPGVMFGLRDEKKKKQKIIAPSTAEVACLRQ